MNVKCDVCNKMISIKNQRRHLKTHNADINNLEATLVDNRNGIFLVNKIGKGPQYPVHVQNKTYGSLHRVFCTEKTCIETKAVAVASGRPGFTCQHVRATQDLKENVTLLNLPDSSLEECQSENLMGNDMAAKCLVEKRRAETLREPLIAEQKLKKMTSNRFHYFSVISDKQHYWSVLGRVVTSFDAHKGDIHCDCCNLKVPCIHKSITLWALFVHNPELLKNNRRNIVQNSQITSSDQPTDLGRLDTEKNISYPPNDEKLRSLIFYVFQNKKIPYNLDISSNFSDFKKSYRPIENHCSDCQTKLSKDVLMY